MAKITRRAEEFRDLHDALQRNLQSYLSLTMDCIAAVYQRTKASGVSDSSRQAVRHTLPVSMYGSDYPPLEPRISEEDVTIVDDVRRHAEVSLVPGCVFVFGKVGRGDRALRRAGLSFVALWCLHTCLMYKLRTRSGL